MITARHSRARNVLSGVAIILLSGCQTVPATMQGNRTMQPMQSVGYSAGDIAPAAGYSNAYTAGYLQQLQSSQEATNMALKERLERIEKALLRLDRRMQLVEQNELSRMSGVVAPGTEGATIGNMEPDQESARRGANLAIPSVHSGAMAMKSLDRSTIALVAPSGGGAGPEVGYQDGFVPVSQDEEVKTVINSPLQAGTRLAGLPSLADPRQAEGRTAANTRNVAIWTVKYDPNKIWPDRNQLPSSRTVVDMIRNQGYSGVFARGANPGSPEFQERVKALSRYLSKVSSLDSLPISALPSPGLDPNTIELLVTR